MILFIKEKRTCFLLLFIILFTASAYSQTEERRVISNVIDLRECLRIGLENNFDLQIARNQELVSENNVTLGNAGYLPQVNVSSGYNLRSSNTDQIPAEGDEVVENRNSNTQTLDAGINLNWSLFEGFRVQTNYKRLKELQSAGELYTRLEMENLIANLTAEYYNYVQQQIRLGNLQYAVSLSKERLRIVEARYQVGSLSRLDLQQAKVDFNADSSQLIQQYEILNRSRIKLNELMGVDVESEFIAQDTTIIFNESLAKDELFDRTMAQNTFLQISESNLTLSELELRNLRSRNYPYLRLNAGYGFTHYNYNSGNLERQRNWGPNVGLTLGYTLFDGFNRKREQKNQQIIIRNRELEVERDKLVIESDFANMWMAYQNNIELTNLEIESLENATINYEIAMERYRIGDLSGLELREAQNSLLEAEQRLLTAQYNTKLYEISLMQISGSITTFLQ
ncbi:MAG: TolC family protein [Lascolabacillus sp.]|uniref:TolC family protein n=1 Tax=Lascolabacillus sp. TaxID=1924068 RepID=UPI00258A5B7A|nr:TolC family protein [Lascolabacillus sp.]MDD3658765.1 TolC family protein [Lascolabacillus sp.]